LPYSRAITTMNAGEEAAKQEHLHKFVITTMDSRMEMPQKTKARTAI
jgi:hypothetical protein